MDVYSMHNVYVYSKIFVKSTIISMFLDNKIYLSYNCTSTKLFKQYVTRNAICFNRRTMKIHLIRYKYLVHLVARNFNFTCKLSKLLRRHCVSHCQMLKCINFGLFNISILFDKL